MKIIVGLGNPGNEYQNTRHNTGFVFVEKLSTIKEISGTYKENKFDHNKKLSSDVLKAKKNGEEILLVKPQTFMNNSGKAVAKVLEYYKIGIENLIVVADDKDIPLGQVRIRDMGGSAGQKGLQSVIDSLGSDYFTRIRIGIGPKKGNRNEIKKIKDLIEAEDYVLSQFSKRELPILNKVIDEAIKYIVPVIGKKDSRIPSHTLNIE